MRAARLLAFALLAAASGGAAAAPAKTPAPAPDPAPMPPGMVKAPPMGDIVFYVAHGDADACGVGCSEWIAAEGKIDPGAAPRLRRLLAKLGRRRPPILFHSPGGNVAASIELGRLIHDQKLTVSVGHTIPRGCDRDKPVDKACDALKRSERELPSDFDPSVWMCNSGCVYVLAAGVTRLVPPWVRLGIHDVGVEPDRKAPAAALAAAARTAHARLQDFSRDMGIDKSLLTASFAIPFESIKAIDRDEIARYGIDRREFGEDVWRFTDKPRPELSKRFFLGMNSGAQRRYRNAYLGLGCGAGPSLRLVLGLLHDPSDQASADVLSMAIAVKGDPVSLGVASFSPRFDVRAASVRADMLDSTGGDATASTLSIELDRKDAGGLALNMDAFAAGYAKLQQSCGQPAQAALPSPAPKPPQREFGEDVWRFSDKPFIELYKRFFFRDGIGEQRRYHDARLSLKCGIGPEIEVVLAHDPAGQSTVDLPPLRIDVKGQRIYLAVLAASPKSELRTGAVGAEKLDSIAGDETALISGIKVGGEDGPAGGIVLKMAGFTAGYAKLKQSCGTAAQAALPSPPPTPPQKYELVRTAIATQRLRLDAIVPICQMGPMSVSVLEQPQHGALTIENGQIDPCRPIDAVVLYEPSAGYAGPDSITLNVAYPFGTVATRHYSIEVTAPAGPASAGEPVSPR